ncbi:MAG: hypothetical protein HOL70_02260 [Candidatus Marinimicrobia bacterium]|jgi:hypothetical protein|nr:hypothetical protein [Candidatus Neomarinimicrobiota bacterium]
MKLGISNGPVTNTTVTPWGLSWDELCKTLQSPEMGLKDGSYFTVCTFSGDHRSGGNIIYPLQGFVLDGDSTIAIDTGELREGAPPPEYVHEALVELDINHLIYTSHSHGTKGSRYRVFVPVEIATTEEHAACVDWMIDQLHQKQVMIANVTENSTISQGWYLPRITSESAPFGFHEYSESEIPLCAAEPLDWHREQQKELQMLMPEPSGVPRELDPSKPIDKFCMDQGIDYVVELLQEHGYVYRHTSNINGHKSYHLMAPNSSSGSAGVNVYLGRDNGKVLVCSHHGEHCAIKAATHG